MVVETSLAAASREDEAAEGYADRLRAAFAQRLKMSDEKLIAKKMSDILGITYTGAMAYFKSPSGKKPRMLTAYKNGVLAEALRIDAIWLATGRAAKMSMADLDGEEGHLIWLIRHLVKRSGPEVLTLLLAAIERRYEAANDSRPAPLEPGDPRDALIITPQYLGPPRRDRHARPPPQGERRTGK